MSSRLLWLVVPACLLPAALAAPPASSPKLRLDGTVRPTHYGLELTLVPDQDTFQGKATIDVVLSAPQETIWLNALNLTITEASAGDQKGEVVEGNRGFVGVRFDRVLPAGAAQLRFTYSGNISRKTSAGVFQLREGDNWYVYTQFEATDARRAFPCFDQPEFKTPWDIALKVRRTDRAFANSPQKSETPVEDGYKVVRFATTRPLPTYLVAFAAGPYDALDIGKSRGGVPLRIITPKGRTGEAKSAAEQIPALLNLLESYFGIPYPFQKLDSLVMPISNFAMENAGLITYGQSLLLAKPGRDSIAQQRLRAVVVAHEMAHQWFGDLVTTAWWNDIWLNEAFATWMEGKIVGEWKPDWRVDAEQVNDRLRVMGTDSLKSSRRVRQPIDSEDDIANAFDGITYQKGAAVIRMFEHWVGAGKFRNGVQLYLKENADRSATARDFLAAVSRAADRDVAPPFSTFLDQPGVPVISLNLLCDGARPRLALAQKSYTPIGSPGGASSQTWGVPVCFRYGADGKSETQCHLLAEKRAEIELRGARSCPAWVYGNDAAVGYYRVAYSDALLKKVLGTDGPRITIPEKVSLLGDVDALVKSGDVPPQRALAMLPDFAKDKAREVVSSTIDIASITVAPYVPQDVVPKGREYIRKLYGEQARQLGWLSRPSDTDDDRLLRQKLTPFVAIEGRDKALIAEASRLAGAWLETHSGVDRNMLTPVLETAAHFGDARLFDKLLAAARAAKDPGQRETLLGALGSFGDPALVRRAMGLLLTGDFDMRQQFYPLLFAPLRDPATAPLPFEFVRQNWDRLIQALPHEVGSDYAAATPMTGSGICDPRAEADYVSFFDEHAGEQTGAPRRFAQAHESIQLCIARKGALGPGIAEFLRTQ